MNHGKPMKKTSKGSSMPKKAAPAKKPAPAKKAAAPKKSSKAGGMMPMPKKRNY
jgi:hypothetical protein